MTTNMSERVFGAVLTQADLASLRESEACMGGFIRQAMIMSRDRDGAVMEWLDESGAVVIRVCWDSTHPEVRAQIEREFATLDN